MSTKLIRCATCSYWNGTVGRAGVCKRHAPAAGERPFQVARWPETREADGCGEGEPDGGRQVPAPQVCRNCLYWDRPGIGIDPAQRGDHLSSWWQGAGWCRRFAPRPGIDIGEHAFWRATHGNDHCYDGQPAS